MMSADPSANPSAPACHHRTQSVRILQLAICIDVLMPLNLTDAQVQTYLLYALGRHALDLIQF